ncbi:MAG: cation:proton antiporter [Pseudomonadota bacterium]
MAAKTAGHLCSHYLKQPQVLGQLLAGMLIGPFALGRLPIPGMGPLFPAVHGMLPVSSELFALSLVGSVVLLLVAGMETDLDVFLRYSVAGLATAVGGAVVSFTIGAKLVVWFGYADTCFAPAALCMGTMALATSVGVTVAVLSELRKIDSPEGATILSAAVIDDVLGLIVLATVVSLIATGSGQTDGRQHLPVNPWHIVAVVVKAALFWTGTMALGILGRRYLRAFLKSFSSVAVSAVALALALFLAALAEKFGLALIIGAYTIGLAFSRLDMAHEIRRRMTPLHEFLVPIVFCVSGMMVDVTSLHGVLFFGLVFASGCIFAKLAGSGLGAWPMGFNLRGVLRIGLGMSPRQEVALIVAATALAHGAISKDLYSAGVLMCLVATVITPPALKASFGPASGLRKEKKGRVKPMVHFHLALPGPEIAELVAGRMVRAFQQEEFYVHMREHAGLYEMRKEVMTVFMRRVDAALEFSAVADDLQYARFIVLEEMIALGDVFRDASRLVEMHDLKRTLLEPGN